MGLTIALAVASTAIQVDRLSSAAKAAKREAALRARQLATQKKQARLTALQQHNVRMNNLKTFIGMNQALSGTIGRDIGSDRSLKAIIDKAKRETSVSVDRARVQLAGEQAQRSFSQRMATMKGNNLARAYRYQAFGTIIRGAYQVDRLSDNKDVTSI